MSNLTEKITVKIDTTEGICPVGETTGKKNIRESKIPVISCEGACIRGEIARLAANILSKEQAYGRGCHGELITVPESAIAQWIKSAEKVVLIDGCFLRCHGRIIENVIDKKKLIQFDALSHYKKYNDIFDYDDVPEVERKEVAGSVAAWIKDCLSNPSCVSTNTCPTLDEKSSACCG
jgi:uncharacterized metal-binding protein